jgi:hypothetical protein
MFAPPLAFILEHFAALRAENQVQFHIRETEQIISGQFRVDLEQSLHVIRGQ